MKIINYISTVAMPMVILIIVIYGIKEKNKVYDNKTNIWKCINGCSNRYNF